MSKDLDFLRREINKLDEELLKIISNRLKISKEIGKFKYENKIPITDLERELELKSRWFQIGKNLGIPETLIDRIFDLILSFSKMFQISPSIRRKVTIIGYGGMARSLVSLLSLAGHNVIVTGRNISKAMRLIDEFKCVVANVDEAIKLAEYIIITTSPEIIKDEIINKIFKLSKDKVVMDIFSSKNLIFEYLESKSEEYGFYYISTHPLFGPITYPVGENIVIIPSKTSKDRFEEVVEFWSGSGLVPIISTKDEHERGMAIVQVLTHYYLLGLLNSIRSLSREFNIDYKKFQTYNFREILKILERIESIL
ncbi:MAG: chorismate mutase, partial [Sulfolobaceae archaeon]